MKLIHTKSIECLSTHLLRSCLRPPSLLLDLWGDCGTLCWDSMGGDSNTGGTCSDGDWFIPWVQICGGYL